MKPSATAAAAAAASTSEDVLVAMRVAMRPLVKLAVASQLTQPAVAEMIKALFVDVAERDFALYAKRSSDSRVHLLTGVHRKDVRRLREESRSAQRSFSTRPSLAGAVIDAWANDPTLCEADGRPRPLPVSSADGREASFESVVRGVSKDIGHRPLLDEWLRLGVVKQLRDGRVALELPMLERGLPRGMLVDRMGVMLNYLGSALLEAMGPAPGPNFSAHAFEEGLREESVQELERMARELPLPALHRMNQRAVELRKADRGKPGADRKVMLGVFFSERRPEAEVPGEPAPERVPLRAPAPAPARKAPRRVR